jgi:hypothetical protein
MQGFNHLSQKVSLEGRVHFTHSGWIITVSMMTASKYVNGVHPGLKKGLSKLFRIKILSNIRNEGRSVKIQVYLAKW